MGVSIVCPKIGSTILCHVKGTPIRDMSNWMKMSVTKPVIWENPTDRSDEVDRDVWQGYALDLEMMRNINHLLYNSAEAGHVVGDWYDFTIPNDRFDIFIVKQTDIDEVNKS